MLIYHFAVTLFQSNCLIEFNSAFDIRKSSKLEIFSDTLKTTHIHQIIAEFNFTAKDFQINQNCYISMVNKKKNELFSLLDTFIEILCDEIYKKKKKFVIIDSFQSFYDQIDTNKP